MADDNSKKEFPRSLAVIGIIALMIALVGMWITHHYGIFPLGGGNPPTTAPSLDSSAPPPPPMPAPSLDSSAPPPPMPAPSLDMTKDSPRPPLSVPSLASPPKTITSKSIDDQGKGEISQALSPKSSLDSVVTQASPEISDSGGTLSPPSSDHGTPPLAKVLDKNAPLAHDSDRMVGQDGRQHDRDSSSRKILSALALMAIERAMEEGRAYRTAWVLLDCCYESSAARQLLERHAAGSIPTYDELERQLEQIVKDAAIEKGAKTGVKKGGEKESKTGAMAETDNKRSWWQNFIRVEKIDSSHLSKDEGMELWRTTLDDLRAGRLQEAITIIGSLRRSGVTGLDSWLDRAELRRQAEQALATLSHALVENHAPDSGGM